MQLARSQDRPVNKAKVSESRGKWFESQAGKMAVTTLSFIWHREDGFYKIHLKLVYEQI